MNSNIDKNFNSVGGIPPSLPNLPKKADAELSKLRGETIQSSTPSPPADDAVLSMEGENDPSIQLENLGKVNIIGEALKSNVTADPSPPEDLELDNMEDLTRLLEGLDIEVLKNLLSDINNVESTELFAKVEPPTLSAYDKDMKVIQEWIRSPQGKFSLGVDLLTGARVKFSRRVITDLTHSYILTPEGKFKQQLHKTTGLVSFQHVKDSRDAHHKDVIKGRGGVKTAMAMADEKGNVSDIRAVVHIKTDLSNAINATKNEEIKKCKNLMVGHFITYKSAKSGDVKEAFLTPYMAKGDLEDKILTFKDAINVSMQVAEGLNVVHNEGWAHLDIKPGNFFYEIDNKREYVAKLADFDFAEDLKNAKSNKLLINGTPGYRSPEMTRFECMGLVGGQQNDIFSLGISMLELAGFSIWHNFVNDDNNTHKTQEEVLDAFEALMSNFEIGSPEYSKVQTEFYKFVANTTPQDYQKSYLNLAWNMINPDPSQRPKINDVVLELKLLDLATI